MYERRGMNARRMDFEEASMAKTLAVASEPNTGIEKLKSGPERLIEFLKDTRNELRKVWTPTATEVRSTTTVVIITVFLFAAYFWAIDNIIGHTIGALLDKLTKH